MSALEAEIIHNTGALAIIRVESVQTLWSDYGEIKRYYLKGGKYASVIVKHIQWPDHMHHPKGWNTELSHQRKLKSYRVESHWYQHFASQTNDNCRVPQVYKVLTDEETTVLIMEDLDASGYPIRLTPETVSIEHVKNCLTWLAHFHAAFMGSNANNLWAIGTYWHLETRPEEWKKMGNMALKAVASNIDQCLNNAKFQTLVHGDAKLANFCFSGTGEVAAVDFQYVGKGCGVKDVAYFISSCFDDTECEKYEAALLTHYFDSLEAALKVLNKHADYQSIKAEWSAMYTYAWADFYRFLDGWSPGHWKMHSYSEKMVQQVIDQLSNNSSFINNPC